MAKLASSSTFALDFLRRLLCAHSADDRPDSAAAARHTCCTPEMEEPTRSPCIVARLMGLDAMPPEALAPHAQLQAQRTPPLRRSRSASSAEGSSSPWDRDTQQPQPRVVRASASLRERPAYLRQESDEFLLLSFSPDDQDPDREREVREELDFLLAATEATATRRGGRVRSDAPGTGSKQRRNGRCRRLRFADDEAESAGRVVLRRTRTPAAECDAHYSSPVSVLEAHDESSTTTTTSSSLEEVEHAEPCSATSDEPQTILEHRNSRRKLHPDFFQLDNMSPPRSSCHVSRCSDRERRNRRVVNKDEVITPEVSGIWQPICRLVEEGLKNMEWLTLDGANVVSEIEYGILEHLICEMVDELEGMSETIHPFPVRSISSKQLGGKNVQTRRATEQAGVGTDIAEPGDIRNCTLCSLYCQGLNSETVHDFTFYSFDSMY
ncbi:hypothetical protein BDA96_09G030700 [Sorghum bicolor]|uniref:DUF3741 domain-containing protein n=1 Tax=Sorghum bicolor TaxID=4558 RepID=A0A921Q9D9_SORBI|nr:hypothetical protein BDA96_09G030700 [Sorghum bicolor]